MGEHAVRAPAVGDDLDFALELVQALEELPERYGTGPGMWPAS